MLAGLTIKPGRRVEVLARTLETVEEKVRGGLSIAQQTPWRVDGKQNDPRWPMTAASTPSALRANRLWRVPQNIESHPGSSRAARDRLPPVPQVFWSVRLVDITSRESKGIPTAPSKRQYRKWPFAAVSAYQRRPAIRCHPSGPL